MCGLTFGLKVWFNKLKLYIVVLAIYCDSFIDIILIDSLSYRYKGEGAELRKPATGKKNL